MWWLGVTLWCCGSYCGLHASNCLFADDGSLRLADFGLARFHRGGPCTANKCTSGSDSKRGPALRPAGCSHGEAADLVALTGRPDMCAPEVLCGREVSPAADVWSLGCLIYHVRACSRCAGCCHRTVAHCAACLACVWLCADAGRSVCVQAGARLLHHATGVVISPRVHPEFSKPRAWCRKGAICKLTARRHVAPVSQWFPPIWAWAWRRCYVAGSSAEHVATTAREKAGSWTQGLEAVVCCPSCTDPCAVPCASR